MSQVSQEPILLSVKDAAKVLGLSTWSMYQLLEKQAIESRYHGTRRLVVMSSLREYAESLPTTRDEEGGESA